MVEIESSSNRREDVRRSGSYEMNKAELIREMKEHTRRNYEKVIPFLIEDFFNQSYGEAAARSQFDELAKVCRPDKDMRILDLGSGYGFLVSHMVESRFDCYGADIDTDACSLAKKLLAIHNQNPERIKVCTQDGAGYHTGFKDAFFHLIHMHFVVEHVANIDHLFKEISRITKPGGKVYFICPNYLVPYEPHYAVFLLMWFPKSVNRLYLRLRGRNDAFLDSLNPVTPRIERTMVRHGFEFTRVGDKRWLEAFSSGMTENRAVGLQNLIKLVNLLRLHFLIRLMTKLGFYTPLIYVLEKGPDRARGAREAERDEAE